jgi:hypothetical protein
VAPTPGAVAILGTPVLVPAVPVTVPPGMVLPVPRPVPVPSPAAPVPPVADPTLFLAVPVPPVAALVPPVVVVVAAGAVRAGRPSARVVVGIRRTGRMGLGGDRRPDLGRMVRLGPGPALPGPGVPGPLRPRALGRLPVRGRHGDRGPVEDRPSDHDPLLPRRAPLHGHDHPANAPRRRPAGRPPARRRAPLRRARPATRRPDPPWFRRLDLDDPGVPRSGTGGSSRPETGRPNDSTNSSLVATIAASDVPASAATPRATTSEVLRRDDTRGGPLEQRSTGGDGPEHRQADRYA